MAGLWVETWKEGEDFVSYCPSVPSSLPPGTDFQYETRTINRIKINNDLEWTNPRTKDSGVGACLPHCIPICSEHIGVTAMNGILH